MKNSKKIRSMIMVSVVALVCSVGACSSEENKEGADKEKNETKPAAAVAIDAPMPKIPDGLESFYEQGVSWSECGKGLECGAYTVPLNYAEPDGAVIHIGVTKRLADGERIGSLLVNPGGPGASGQSMAIYANQLFPQSVREHFDIIGFDPRGVGESSPVDCMSDGELYEMISASYPNTPEGEKAAQEDAQEFVEGCTAESGPILAYLGTDNAARDMDVIRAVEGDPGLYYVGFSYGTELGAAYARLFPENVGRMVLDGASGINKSSFEQTKAQLVGFEKSLNTYLDWCLNDAKTCPFSGSQEQARTKISELFEQALAEPFPTALPDEPLTQTGLLYGIITPLYQSDTYAYHSLNGAFSQLMDDNDGTHFARLFNQYMSRDQETGEFVDNSMEANIAISCADDVPQTGPATWEKQEEELEEAAPIFGPVFGYSEAMCDLWPERDKTGLGDPAAPGAEPIVVVGTTGDPATPYQWAQDLSDLLNSGVLVTWEGEGHTAYGRSNECVEEPITAYLLTGIPPQDGLTCSPE